MLPEPTPPAIDSPAPWIRPAQQKRSQESLNRVLLAAEELFGTHGFEQTSVARIAAAAGCSVGTIYARFQDKEALLHLLHEKLAREAEATAEALLANLPAELPLVEAAEAQVRFLLKIYSLRPQLILAIYFRVPTDLRYAQRAEAMIHGIATHLARFLADRPDLQLSDPRGAAEFAIRMLFGALHQRALHRDSMALIPDAEFAARLTRAFVGYLRAEEAGGSQ
jgi:AcrR family transcriptional regulator